MATERIQGKRAVARALLLGCVSLTAACGRSPIRATPEGGTDASADSVGPSGGGGRGGGGSGGSAADARLDTQPPIDTGPADVGPDRPDGSADTRDAIDAIDAFDGAIPDRPPDNNTCAVDCTHLPHVLAGVMIPCRNNECVIPANACEPDWAHCRGSGNGGCESNLTTNTDCGYCNYGCMVAGTQCRNVNGYRYCSQQCLPPNPDSCGFGCTDTQTDQSNCGACGVSCYQSSAEVTCQQGKCAVVRCTTGYADCIAGNDGCETQLGTDINCGACGDKSCQLANTLFTCSDGAARCDSALCAPGFANCDAASPDCEAPFTMAASCLPHYTDTLAIATGFLDLVASAIAPDGSTFLAGSWTGTVDFDPSAGRDIRMTADQDSYVTKFNADGTYAWTAAFTGRGSSNITGLAATPTGAVVAAGTYSDSIDLDPSPVSVPRQTPTPDQSDTYFVELTAAGAFAWGGSFQGTAFSSFGSGASVAVDATGAVFLASVYNGTIDFDPGPAVFTHTSSSDAGALVKLSAAGAFQSARFYDNDVCSASLSSVTVASDGSVWAVGTAGTGSSCPLDPRDALYSQGSVLIVKHDAANTPIGKWLIGSSDSAYGIAVAAGAAGAVYVGGNSSSIDLDPGPGVAQRWLGAYSGGFILKLDASGSFRWARVVTDGSVQALTTTPDGGVIAIATRSSPFVTRLGPDGGAIWSFSPGTSSTSPQTLASGAGRFAIAGTSSGTNDMDPGPDLDLVYGDIEFVSRYSF